jgi:hypothetical protein
MKYVITILLLAICHIGQAQQSVLTDDPTIAIPKLADFFCKDTFKEKPIIVMFRWDARNKDRPVCGQAFSPDEGKTWEWNFFNVSERIK